jgi:hypothetical protein
MKQRVNKKDFFDLLWRLEEILMQSDHLSETRLANVAEAVI